jgi:hypothetical protein
MRRRTLIIRSACSGVIWAAIAILLMTIAGSRVDSVGSIGWRLHGGIVVAPFIGIAVGCCSGIFRHAGFGGRVAVAVVTLYVAAFLFMLGAGLTAFAAGDMQQPTLATVLFDSWNAAIAGLTWTGFVLVLGPLAYLNHLLISGSSAVRTQEETAAG